MARMGAAIPLADKTEKAWDGELFGSQKGLATMLGWRLCYHTLRSKGSQPGFPDRVLVRDRVIFVELKREKEKPTDRQYGWLTGLAIAGAEVYLWRPSDLDEIGRILGSRWHWNRHEPGLCERGDLDNPWQPGSLWLAGGWRRDEVPQPGLVAA